MSNQYLQTIDGGGALYDRLQTIARSAREDIVKKVQQAGAKELQKATVESLIRKVGAGVANAPGRFNHPMVKGVTTWYDRSYREAAVSIRGDFKLPWFELGTTERFLKGRGRIKTRAYRGSMLSKRGGKARFFQDARRDTTRIENAMQKTFEKEIDKLWY